MGHKQLNETLQEISRKQDRFHPNTGPLLQALMLLESLNKTLQTEIYGDADDLLLIVTEKNHDD